MNSPVSTVWAVGDLQGCNQCLQELLAHPDIAADPKAQIWFCGDLVNRGPDSKGTLDTVMALGDRAVCVLGNHDLHLLGVVAGAREPGKNDTLSDILNAPNADDYIDWLRHRNMAHYDQGHLMVHAGVPPAWSLDLALACAAEVEQVLRSDNWQTWLPHMYGNKPRRWRNSLTGDRRLRYIVNALTRMRLCSPDGKLDFKHKNKPVTTAEVMPWFDVPDRAAQDTPIVFGHWSALGFMARPNLVCLDTGCVWGRKLTAMRLHDRKVVSVDCANQCVNASR